MFEYLTHEKVKKIAYDWQGQLYLICICRQFFLLHRLNTEYGVGEDQSFTDNINFLQYKVTFATIDNGAFFTQIFDNSIMFIMCNP